MRTAGVLSVIAICLCASLVDGKCDPRVVQKIRELRVDTTNILDTLKGVYIIFHFSAGDMNEEMKKECSKIRFFKEGKTHKLEYERFIEGAYTLETRDGSFAHLGKGHNSEPEMTYYPFINDLDLLGVYVCNKGDEAVSADLTYLAVPVGRPTVGLGDRLKKAVELEQSLGLPAGVDTDGCFNKDNDQPRGQPICAMEKRTYYVLACPQSEDQPAL